MAEPTPPPRTDDPTAALRRGIDRHRQLVDAVRDAAAAAPPQAPPPAPAPTEATT